MWPVKYQLFGLTALWATVFKLKTLMHECSQGMHYVSPCRNPGFHVLRMKLCRRVLLQYVPSEHTLSSLYKAIGKLSGPDVRTILMSRVHLTSVFIGAAFTCSTYFWQYPPCIALALNWVRREWFKVKLTCIWNIALCFKTLSVLCWHHSFWKLFQWAPHICHNSHRGSGHQDFIIF